MAEFKQADRPLTVTTPLAKDVLLLRALSGHEGVSQLFSFQLDLIAENTADVSFDKLLGGKITAHLTLPDKSKRHFNGVCVRLSQGERDPREKTFTAYRAEIVPDFWLLTRKAQSRIFQHLSVHDILKKVLVGFEVEYLLPPFEPRDFCVQYRETDFNFASRLMEEEGIYYFFKHSDGSHKMVVANTPQSHPDVSGKTKITYEDVETGFRDDDRINDWEKVQELRSGKYILWDHSFELPHKHLEAEKTIQDSVTVGKITHKLKVGGNDKLEIYDFPGEYAQRFDGVDKGGGDRPADLQKIFNDNKRTVEIRMQEEALPSLLIHGASNCRQLASGHKFTLEKHFSGEGGPYVLTSVTHSARGAGEYRAGTTGAFSYTNQFTCIPVALPFRPPRTTPKPVVHGTQSAVVVGPSGEEIFTDKYGRVKVQFHWDREGKNNVDSSCWLRVATLWAGKQWGMIHIPRIGQEVVVDFLEGDPDQPIVVGSVYNSDMMPPYELPKNKTQSGIKTRSSLGGDPETFNELCFEDKKGQELVYLRAEKDLTIAVENDEAHWVGHDREKTVDHDETVHVKNNRTETVDNDESVTVGNSRTVTVNQKDDKHQIKMGNREVKIDMGNDKLTIGMGNQTTDISLGKSETTAMQSIELKVGQSSVKLDQMGVTIKGMMISIEGQITTNVKGLMTTVEGQAMTDVKGVMTTLQGQAITQVKGAITQVNGDGILMAHGGITLIG
jgi:type VI secretion system secreted protein VgrG